jgi:hypothetical protein
VSLGQKNFADFDEAKKKAREVAKAVAKGEADAHRTTNFFMADACRAYSILRGAGFETVKDAYILPFF